jgi:hypothetical protein
MSLGATYVSVVLSGLVGRSAILLDLVVSDPAATYCARTESCSAAAFVRHMYRVEPPPFRADRVRLEARGGSMVTSESSWNKWFGTMSRKAPVAS